MPSARPTPEAERHLEPGEQHSLSKSIGLHLWPGVSILGVFVATAPYALRVGLPPLVPVLGSAALGLGIQVWHLFREGRRRNGRWSLEHIVVYRQAVTGWQYVALVPTIIVLAFIVNGMTAPVGGVLLKLMPWLPPWFEMRDPGVLMTYPRPTLLWIFLGLYLPINGIAAPIVEELYFRGYLMPRLSRFRRWTPVIAVALFTLYHFWQPYYWPTQFLSVLPLAYVVWWKRSVTLGIVIHAALNIVGGFLTFAFVLG